MSGQYAFRTGVGNITKRNQANGWDLQVGSSAPPRLPKMLRSGQSGGYNSAALGKWHLDSVEEGTASDHAIVTGFGSFVGVMANFGSEIISSGGVELETNYFTWKRVVGGSFNPGAPGHFSVYSDPFNPSAGNYSNPGNYATRFIADEAIKRIDSNTQDNLAEPWLLYVAFNGAHAPFHIPPSNRSPTSEVPTSGSLYTLSTTLSSTPTKGELHRAMIESVDIEVGRILGALPTDVAAHTTVMLFADNGTPNDAAEAPYPGTGVKGTLFEGGINVPFIIKSPRLANYSTNKGKDSTALATVADLFDTVKAIAVKFGSASDVDNSGGGEDSESLIPILEHAHLGTPPSGGGPADDSIHQTIYAEFFSPIGRTSHESSGAGWDVASVGHPSASRYQESYRRAVRDEQYKLMRENGKDVKLFDLVNDPFENSNLISSTVAAHVAAKAYLIGEMNRTAGIPLCAGTANDPTTYRDDIDGDLHCDAVDICLMVADTDFDNPADQNDDPAAQQNDADSDGYGDSCDGDFNNTASIPPNAVAIIDFNTLRSCFGRAVGSGGPGDDANCSESDMDDTGTVSIFDFYRFRELFGKDPGDPPYCRYTDLCSP
jgi:hypothetical protein